MPLLQYVVNMCCFLVVSRIPEGIWLLGGVANESAHHFNISRHRPNVHFSMNRPQPWDLFVQTVSIQCRRCLCTVFTMSTGINDVHLWRYISILDVAIHGVILDPHVYPSNAPLVHPSNVPHVYPSNVPMYTHPGLWGDCHLLLYPYGVA